MQTKRYRPSLFLFRTVIYLCIYFLFLQNKIQTCSSLTFFYLGMFFFAKITLNVTELGFNIYQLFFMNTSEYSFFSFRFLCFCFPLVSTVQDFDPQQCESLKWMLANTGMRDMGFDFEDIGLPDKVTDLYTLQVVLVVVVPVIVVVVVVIVVVLIVVVIVFIEVLVVIDVSAELIFLFFPCSWSIEAARLENVHITYRKY